ncbi:MAG: anhydro-N-acetylmuramic acid kinase [Bacteroidia bacterium]|nr:anhydro-N-acetylmuramic acid kinase [Bacteroidia bacterium]MDW8088821.1 anhydro-N-acetylmuramic acid kinase [Bacteroidia bacterium]
MKPSWESSFRVLTLMAGSSADGVSAALMRLRLFPTPSYELLVGKTLPYPEALHQTLQQALNLPAPELFQLSITYTDWTADILHTHFSQWIYDLIVWHPHNLYHSPSEGLTWSLGDSERLRAKAKAPIVTHLRARDIAWGGTGAPLIPNADAYLFTTYQTLINLGGIANITHLPTYVAYDIGPCNQLLNALAAQAQPPLPYDPEGQIAASGQVIPELLETFLAHPFFQHPPPKALDNRTVQEDFVKLFCSYSAPLADRLHTAVIGIVHLLKSALIEVGARTFTLTGGGTYNTFLVRRLVEMVEPLGISYRAAPAPLVDYREAIGFGLLGLWRWLNHPNIDRRWTGAQCDTYSGLLSL